jgi:hypothetical protein
MIYEYERFIDGDVDIRLSHYVSIWINSKKY